MDLGWTTEWWAVLEPWWAWIGVGSGVLTVALLLASLVGLPWVIAGLPEDYLQVEPPPAEGASRWVRNLLGAVLVLLGVLMLVLPGQGLLTLLAGVLLMDLPGKRRWILWALRRPAVLAMVNAIRRRRGVAALDEGRRSSGGA